MDLAEAGSARDESTTRVVRRGLLLLLALAWVAQVALIWWYPYPPLVDLPAHVAQHALEYRWWTGAGVPPYYRFDYRLVPYMGSELTITPMLAVLSPTAAAKVFLSISVTLFSLGPMLYIRASAGRGLGALCAGMLLVPLAFFSVFLWGFINYYSGLGLTFLVLAHLLARMERGRGGWTHWLLHSALIAMLFVWHLAAWFIYGLIASIRVGLGVLQVPSGPERWARLRGFALPWLAATLPSLALLLLYKMQSTDDFAVGLSRYEYGGLIRKLFMPFLMFRAYDAKMDVLVAMLWLAALLCWFRPWPRLTLGIRTNLFAIAGSLVFYLLTPKELGTTSEADIRILPVIYVGVLAILAECPLGRLIPGMMILAACVVVRYVDLARHWERIGSQLNAYADAFDSLPRRARVLTLAYEDDKDPPVRHFVAWAVPTREIFDPNLFAYPGQTALRLVDPCQGDESRENVGCYDVLWVFERENGGFKAPPGFELKERRGLLTVWQRIAAPQPE